MAEAGGCCAVCGYRRTILNLHFPHVDPSAKSFQMNAAAGKSLAAYRAEAAKCVLVCANCHGEIEAGLIPSPPAGAKFGECWNAPPEPVVTEPAVEASSAVQLSLLMENAQHEARRSSAAPQPCETRSAAGVAADRGPRDQRC